VKNADTAGRPKRLKGLYIIWISSVNRPDRRGPKGGSAMSESHPSPVYSGLLEPQHYKKIGSAIWLFLWCVSTTTKEVERDGVTWGIVLGNKPLKLNELASQFGVNEQTVRRWLEALEKHEYIKVTRAPHGRFFITPKLG